MGVSLQYSNGNVGFFTKSKANRSFDFVKSMKEENVTVSVGGYTYYFGRASRGNVELRTYVSPPEQILFLPPRKTKPKWKEFFKFDTLTASFLALVIFCCGLLFFKLPPLHSFWLSFQVFIQLATFLEPKSFSSKFFMWFVLVFSMLVNTFYLSILSGFFTEPNYEAKITTFEDFAKSDVVLDCGEHHFWLLSNLYDSTTLKMVEKKVKYTRRTGLAEILYFLDRPDHAFVSTQFGLEYVNNKVSVGKIRILSSLHSNAPTNGTGFRL
jgi:hypothetical protein